VVVVEVGQSTSKNLIRFAADEMARAEIIAPATPYSEPTATNTWRNISVDPFYEAKVVPYLLPGDLFWISGNREPQHPGTDRQAHNEN
jgi:hypothetical protein